MNASLSRIDCLMDNQISPLWLFDLLILPQLSLSLSLLLSLPRSLECCQKRLGSAAFVILQCECDVNGAIRRYQPPPSSRSFFRICGLPSSLSSGESVLETHLLPKYGEMFLRAKEGHFWEQREAICSEEFPPAEYVSFLPEWKQG